MNGGAQELVREFLWWEVDFRRRMREKWNAEGCTNIWGRPVSFEEVWPVLLSMTLAYNTVLARMQIENELLAGNLHLTVN